MNFAILDLDKLCFNREATCAVRPRTSKAHTSQVREGEEYDNRSSHWISPYFVQSIHISIVVISHSSVK
jgi:hypothetical protein